MYRMSFGKSISQINSCQEEDKSGLSSEVRLQGRDSLSPPGPIGSAALQRCFNGFKRATKICRAATRLNDLNKSRPNQTPTQHRSSSREVYLRLGSNVHRQ